MRKQPVNIVYRKNRDMWEFRRKVGGKAITRALARKYSDALIEYDKLIAGPIRSSTMTIRQAAERWLKEYVINNRKGDKGQQLAATRVDRYLVPRLGYLPLHKLSKRHCHDYRRFLDEQSIAPQTVNHVLSDFRCMLNWCEEVGLIDRSPFPRRLFAKVQERPPQRLSDEEVEILESLPDPLGFVLRLALGTGLRWAELCRSQREDVEGEFLEVHQTKSGKMRRVPIPRALLEEIHQKQMIGRLVPYEPSSSSSFNKRVREKSGLKGFSMQECRHTYATRQLEAGVSLAVVQHNLGHQSIVTTQRYDRVLDGFALSEVRRVEALGTSKGVAMDSQVS